MFDDYTCEEKFSIINYFLTAILGVIAVTLIVLFYVYSKKVYNEIHFKTYINFIQFVVMPAIIFLPFLAGILSNIMTAKNEELKDEILVLISNILLICACIMSIKVLADTAKSVIDYTPGTFDFFYKFKFLFYPLENDTAKAITIVILIFIGGVLSSTKNIPSIICACVSIGLNLIFIIALRKSTGFSSESEQEIAINLLLYGNLFLSILSCVFPCVIETE